MKAPEVKHDQLSEYHVRREATRPTRRDLEPQTQKVPCSFPDVVIDRPIRHEPRSVGEVAGPPAQYTVKVRHDLFPWLLVCRTKDLPDASLDPLHRPLGRHGPQVPVSILPVAHRTKGVAQESKRLMPPIAHPGLLLVERQAHLYEPPATLREHLRRPVATQDHEVVRVVHEPRPVAPVEPPETEDLQVAIHVEVREQRRDHPALRRAPRRPLASALPPPSTRGRLRHWRLEPQLQQSEHLPITEPPRQRLHQLPRRDRVEILRHVRVPHLCVPGAQRPVHLLNGPSAPPAPADSHRPRVPGPPRRSVARSAARRSAPPGPE